MKRRPKGNLVRIIFRSPVMIIFMVFVSFVIGSFGPKLLALSNQAPVVSQTKQSGVVPPKEIKPTIVPDEVLSLINSERTEAGLNLLKTNIKLEEAALRRAKIIINDNDWSHEATKSGITYKKTMEEVGYWNIEQGENLARGFISPSTTVRGWMESPSHRENIMNPNYQETGIAVYSGSLGVDDTTVVVQLFGGYRAADYTPEYLAGWVTTLNRLKEIEPNWEALKNDPGYYEANKQDIDRIVELINIRIFRIEKIVNRIQSSQWLTSEENGWTYEDEALYKEQEMIATRLNS